MGKASKALQDTLQAYGISQSLLASTLSVDRPIVFRWYHGHTDPTSETLVKIVEALRQLEPASVDMFVSHLLGSAPSPHQVNIPASLNESLPESNCVNVSALSGLFFNTTNSYKYLFFLAILEILKRRNFENFSPITFREIVIEMLANAWYPYTFFQLSFGTQDKISQKLSLLKKRINIPLSGSNKNRTAEVRRAISNEDITDIVVSLRRYVPFLLLVPFCSAELKQKKDIDKKRSVETLIPRIVYEEFQQLKPLYKFNSSSYKDSNSIIFHPDWINYLERNYSIVFSWASWEWLQYMQRRNPSTPALANKLFAPVNRSSLSKQLHYWKEILLSGEHIECIYSGQKIELNKFSLDHYLPWSFVAHDQLWNLIPATPEANSSKSNNLPSKKYFLKFIEVQYLGLTHVHSSLSQQRWAKTVEPFVSDLGLNSTDDLLDLEKLINAYSNTISPLLSLAQNQGFSADWQFSS